MICTFQNPSPDHIDYCEVEFIDGTDEARILKHWRRARTCVFRPDNVDGAFRFDFAPGMVATGIYYTINSGTGGSVIVVNPKYIWDYPNA